MRRPYSYFFLFESFLVLYFYIIWWLGCIHSKCFSFLVNNWCEIKHGSKLPTLLRSPNSDRTLLVYSFCYNSICIKILLLLGVFFLRVFTILPGMGFSCFKHFRNLIALQFARLPLAAQVSLWLRSVRLVYIFRRVIIPSHGLDIYLFTCLFKSLFN